MDRSLHMDMIEGKNMKREMPTLSLNFFSIQIPLPNCVAYEDVPLNASTPVTQELPVRSLTNYIITFS